MVIEAGCKTRLIMHVCVKKMKHDSMRRKVMMAFSFDSEWFFFFSQCQLKARVSSYCMKNLSQAERHKISGRGREKRCGGVL